MARATTSRKARSLRGWYLAMKGRAVFIHENPAFAPDCFGNEEIFGLGVIQTGGVKLDEFHVGNVGPGPVGDGHPVAGGDIRVAGIEIDLAGAAGGQQDDGGNEGVDLTGVLIEDVDTHAGFLGIGDDRAPADQLMPGDEIHGDLVFEDGDIGLLQDPGHQDAYPPPDRSYRGHG